MAYDPNQHGRIDMNDPRVVRYADSGNTTLIVAVAVAMAIVLGVTFFAMTGDDRTASTTPPATTGQGQSAPAAPTPSNPAPAQPKAE
jgi:hypothetical protein